MKIHPLAERKSFPEKNPEKIGPGSAGMDVFGEDTCHACASAIISDSIRDESCFPGGDGQISLQVTVSTKNYEILWDNGETGLTRDSLSPGVYEITGTDGYEWETPDSIIVGGAIPTGVTGQWHWKGA